MLVLRYVTHLLPCPVMCHGDVEKHSKSLWYSELLTTHARKTEPEINCSILHLFAYQPKALLGSPPHRRGKAPDETKKAMVEGITPAWAGKRSQVAAALQSGWDHPRIGGEKAGIRAGGVC